MLAIEKTPAELFAPGIDANVAGTFNRLTAVARRMLPAGAGSIIVIASIAGMSGHRGVFPGDSAAKTAVIEMAQNMGSAWAGRGVRVNATAPGWFPSEMTDGLLGIPALAELIDQMTPTGRIGHPEELVGPLLLLASDAGSYVTGSVVAVDGGWTSTTGSSPPSDDLARVFAGFMPDGLGEPILPVRETELPEDLVPKESGAVRDAIRLAPGAPMPSQGEPSWDTWRVRPALGSTESAQWNHAAGLAVP